MNIELGTYFNIDNDRCRITDIDNKYHRATIYNIDKDFHVEIPFADIYTSFKNGIWTDFVPLNTPDISLGELE